VAARGPRLERAPGVRPLVFDRSARWAGPLCTQLLRRAAGARVLRVESRSRAQAPRSGYFARLDAGVERVALDLGVASGRDALHRLLERADIVVESARPRALRQLGVEAEAWVAARPGLTWVAISGYGRREPRAGWVAFGDDAAAAAGLAELAGRGTDGPLFCADAVADPLTGLHASVAALVHHEQGGGVLLDLSLRDVAAQATRFADAAEGARVVATRGGHAVLVGGARAAVAAPRPRRLARARRAVAGLASAAPGPRACARAPKRSLA
jgi:crotonobetainyl-CoA:carnitine CoA-transferase CaiB-like acyl-CoA transferase